MTDQLARSARVNLRVEPSKKETWAATAKAEKQTLTAWLESLADDAVTVHRQIARNEQLEAERGRWVHGLDPSEAERLDWLRLDGPGEDGAT